MSKPNNYMLFGLPGADLRAASRRVEALFGFAMTLISSGAWGDYYVWDGPEGEEIRVYQNAMEDEDGKGFHEPDYAEFPLLVEVVDVADQDGYLTAILGDPEMKATRLLREVYSKGPAGEVICEIYSPNGEVTVERFLHGVRITDESD